MKPTGITDIIYEQIINISKAGAFDIVSKHNQELQEENKLLKERVKYLQDLVVEYSGKMKANLSGGKVDEFLKSTIDDIDPDHHCKPGLNNDKND